MKYITVLMIIVFSCFVILTALMTAFVSSYSVNFKKATVHNIAGAMAVYVKKDFAKNEKLITYNDDFRSVVELLSSETEDMSSEEKDITIFVINENSAVTAFATSGRFGMKDFFVTPDYGNREKAILSDELSARLKRGETLSGTDDMSGLFRQNSIYTAYPIFINDEYAGSVVVAIRDTGMDPLMHSTVMALVMASLWIMLASLTGVYIISEKLTTPIRKMNSAAKKMAKGNFDTKVEVKGKDEIAQLSQSFNEMASSLGNLERMRSSFISDVSHELRTPMTSIGGFVDSILDGTIPPEKEKYYLEIVSSEIKRLTRLVNTLLEISRLESGHRKLEIAAFDICELARIILISNEQRLEEKRLDVEFNCDAESIEVIGDRDSIHECLFNLCDNAIKFSKEGGRYEVSIKDVGQKVEISVFNEGIGITGDDLPFIFERFYKSDKSRGLDKKGVGLGLYLVKSQIAAHGEDIWCESESGAWCRFTFTLQKKKT